MSSQNLEYPHDIGHVIVSSLIALEFNSFFKKPKVYLNEQIFRKMNQKLGDHILYFLFFCIDSHHATKVFRDCWPIYDKKVEAQFRNIAFEWYKSLSQCEDFNLSPSLVVSKATMMPTSNKFMMTLYSLCRFALHTKIVEKDPSEDILMLPVLATKVDQRQNAMKLIHKSKIYHHYEYVKAVKERTEILETLRDKAKNLVKKYKTTLEKRESAQNELRSLIEKSAFLSSAQKEKLPAASFQEFKSEIEKDLKMKNEDIQFVWSNTSQLRRQDDESWPLIESIIVGNKGIFTISGKDYPDLVNLSFNVQFPLKEEGYLNDCYRGGILNLVALFRLSSYAFKLLRDCINNMQERNVDKEGFRRLIESLQNQSKCVKSLKEDAQKFQSMLDGLLSSLLHSVMKLRQQIETQYSVSAHSDSFALAPPTPSFSLDRSTTHIPEFESRYHLIELTPSCNETTDISSRSVNSFSYRKNASQCGRSESDSRTLQSDYASPSVPTAFANTRSVSSNRLTLDSGCVLSCGTDSLLQSLDKLDVTPKRSHLASFQNDLYQTKSNRRNSSLSSLNFYKRSILRKRQSMSSPMSFLSSCRSNSPEELSDRLSTPRNLKSLNIEANSSPIFNKSDGCFERELSISYQSVPSDEVIEVKKNIFNTGNYCSRIHERIENVTPHLIDSDILNKSREITSVERHDAKLSPLVSKLLTELQADCNKTLNSGNSKFGMFARGLGHALKEGSTQLPSRSQSVSSVKLQVNDLAPTVRQKTETISSSFGKGSFEQCSNADVEKRFHSQMSSLESWLAREEQEKNSAYDLDISCSTKDTLVFSNDSRDLNILTEENEEFVDGKSFLEDIDCRKNTASKFLSNTSPFDTVTEALIAGELDTDLLLNKEVDSEIRRESIDISRRDSVLSLSRRGEGISTRLSQIFKDLSLEGDNIFDESESCLLSSSCDEF